MLEKLDDKIKFKFRNLRSWERNTPFWLNSELRQLADTKEFLLQKIPSLFKGADESCNVVDMGTSNGWAFQLLQDLNISSSFIGLDFNQLFIDHLKNKYKAFNNADFITVDLEEQIPEKLFSTADFVFNFFNFFETASLETAFRNAAKMLKPKGKLVILTIDNFYLMVALAKTMDEFKQVLKTYEEMKAKNEVPFFFQKIDLGNREADDLEYASVLYSFEDYYNQAKANSLQLTDYAEITKTSKFIPKVYKYIVFENAQ